MGYIANKTKEGILNITAREKERKVIIFLVAIFIEAIIWVLPWRIFVFSSLKKAYL